MGPKREQVEKEGGQARSYPGGVAGGQKSKTQKRAHNQSSNKSKLKGDLMRRSPRPFPSGGEGGV